MSIELKIVLIIIIVFSFLSVIRRLILKKISVRYGTFSIIFLMLFSISLLITNGYGYLAKLLNISEVSILVCFILIFLLFYIILILLCSISKLNEKTKSLIQELSILKGRVDEYERKE